MKLFEFLNENIKGILCLVSASFFLVISDTITKWLSPVFALHEIMLFRSCFAMVLVIVFVQLEGGFIRLKTKRPVLHLVRGLLMVFANMFFFMALASMPIAETVALFFVAPSFICILAQPVLGEKVTKLTWLSILIGLTGVIVMVKPGVAVFNLTSLFPIGAAFAYAAMHMATRKLGMQDNASTLTFYIQVVLLIVSGLMGVITGDGRFEPADNTTWHFLFRSWSMPDLISLFLLACSGIAIACGSYLMSQAYRISQASVVAPFEYTSMPFALIIGFVVWGDWPDIQSLVGVALIVLSGLMIAYFEKHKYKYKLEIK